jgi:hypothetical protein
VGQNRSTGSVFDHHIVSKFPTKTPGALALNTIPAIFIKQVQFFGRDSQW